VAAPAEPEQTTLSPSQEAAARAALQQRMAELNAAETTAAVPPSVPAPTPAPVPTAPPITAQPAPTPAVPSQKQGLERLAELTQQYRAGLLSPSQYHQERAKIVQSLK
jgi:hypothetical protein